MRAFIAVDLPAAIKQRIHTETTEWRQSTSRMVRWVDSDRLHLTLKFLGESSARQLVKLTGALSLAAQPVPSFSGTVTGLGCFPNPRRPRVLWAGLAATPAWAYLQSVVEAVAAQQGYPPEEKPFFPHVTLGRVRDRLTAEDRQRLSRLWARATLEEVGTFLVDAIHIYRSELTPDGAVYSRQSTMALQS